MNNHDSSELYDVIIAGGGPSGLSVGSELAKAGFKILVIEKNTIGFTQRSWIVPGNIIEALDPGAQACTYNGVTRFLEYTSGLSIKWDATAPWEGSPEWKRYPYIRQPEILKYWGGIIEQHGSTIKQQTSFIDYTVDDDKGTVSIKVLPNDNANDYQCYTGKLLIDATGYSSQIAKRNIVSRKGYYWWSVYGFDIEFDDVTKLNNPGDLGPMKVGDYMLWQSFDDIPMDTKQTLAELRPIMEYEVLDEKTIFVFILYFSESVVDKDYMVNQFNYILDNEDSIKAFKTGKRVTERYGFYPSCSISQRNSVDRVALIGDADCWTIPAGWGMTFILQNYKAYAESLAKLIKENRLGAADLNSAARFNTRKKFEILTDRLVLHFLAQATPDLIDKFTLSIFNTLGGKQLEIMFCLELTEKEAVDTVKMVLKQFSLKELMSVFSIRELPLLLEIGYEFSKLWVIDLFRKFTGKQPEEGGFEFKAEEEKGVGDA